MKKRADFILSKLQINMQQTEAQEPPATLNNDSLSAPSAFDSTFCDNHDHVSEVNKENLVYTNLSQPNHRKRKLVEEDLESERSNQSSPSIIENTPEKCVRTQILAQELGYGKQKIINLQSGRYKQPSPSIIKISPEKSACAQILSQESGNGDNEKEIREHNADEDESQLDDKTVTSEFQNKQENVVPSRSRRVSSSSSTSSSSSSTSDSSSSSSSSQESVHCSGNIKETTQQSIGIQNEPSTSTGIYHSRNMEDPTQQTIEMQNQPSSSTLNTQQTIEIQNEPSTSTGIYHSRNMEDPTQQTIEMQNQPSSSTLNTQQTIEIQNEPSTSTGIYRNSTQWTKNYFESHHNSEESDVDLSDNDPTYRTRPLSRLGRAIRKSRSTTSHTSSSSSSSSDQEEDILQPVTEDPKRSRKRQRNPAKWKQNLARTMRNRGQAYTTMKNKKTVPARALKPPCTSKCRLKCIDNINEDARTKIFTSYWALGDIELQRCYIRSCTFEVHPKYKYTNAARPRKPNSAFNFTVENTRIRVCKTFFTNTLDISNKQIRTVQKKTDEQGFLAKDNRGKHKDDRKRVDPAVIQAIKDHINSIPRIESHYLRSNTTREYIGGEKTIADLWRDFTKDQNDAEKPACKYWIYYLVFTKDFNLGFFQPKKDRCDLCFEHELGSTEAKLKLKEKYDTHLKEKALSRTEKRTDRQNIDKNNICAVFDLQAVMQCPSGETSAFYYKSKLNCLNLTIVELLPKKTNNTDGENQCDTDTGAYGNVYSYFWDETQGKRGAIEIGSCLYDYLNILNTKHEGPINVTFYSDNCCGQNKNKFIAALYSYAVSCFNNIESITHKFLIKGHTQNEGDNVHSLIEKEIKRNKRGGPMYAPCQYVSAIKSARKVGNPFIVKELTYDFFWELRLLQEMWGYNFNENESKRVVAWNDIKILKFVKNDVFKFGYKTSYSQMDFMKVNMRNKRRRMTDMADIELTKAYSRRFDLTERKLSDLRSLLTSNLIPRYYQDFYKSILY